MQRTPVYLAGFVVIAVVINLMPGVPWTGALAAAADAEYEEESASGPYSYYYHPSTVVGVPDNQNATQIHPDTWGRMVFFTGETPRVFQKRIKTLYRGHLPIVECSDVREGIRYDIQAFGATLSGKSEDELVMFVKLSATNETKTPKKAFVWASAVYNPRKNVGGYYRSLFTADRSYAMAGDAATENGKVLYHYDAGAVAAKFAAIGSPYKRPVSAAEAHSIPMTAMCLVRYDWNLKPGQTQSAVVKVPHNLIDAKQKADFFNELRGAKYDAYYQKTVDFWDGLLADGTQFLIPHKKTSDKLRTALLYLMIAREKKEDGRYYQYVDRIQYPRPFFRDSIFTQRVYDLYGHPENSRQCIAYLQGTRFGANSTAIHLDKQASLHPPRDDDRDLSKYGQKLWRYCEHFLFTDNKAYAKEIMPEVKAIVAWMDDVTAKDERGLIPRCTLIDNEFVKNGHRVGDNFWLLASLRGARLMAQRSGEEELAAQITRILDRVHPALLKAIDGVMREAGYVAGTLDHGTSDRNSGWGEDRDNQLMVWPSEALPPHHAAVTASLKRIRSRYQEGVSGHYDGQNGATFVYRTLWGMQQHLARGDQELLVKDLYAVLAHTGSTHGGYEIAWKARWGIETHGWHWARYVSLLRNMIARETWDGSIHLLSTVPADWAEVGNKIGVTNLPTHYGPLSFVETILDDGAEIELKPAFRYSPKRLVLHMPYFAQVSKVVVDGKPATVDYKTFKDGAVELPAAAKRVRIHWQTKPTKTAAGYAEFLAQFRKTLPPARIPLRYFPSADERRELWNSTVIQPWKVIGPFPDPNRNGYETVFPPETELNFAAKYKGLNGQEVQWRDRPFVPVEFIPARIVRVPWYRANFQTKDKYAAVDFAATLANSNGTAYAYSNVYSPKDQSLTMSLGTDGPVVVWLDGKRVHGKKEFRGWRGISPDKDRVAVKLNKGWTPVLIKVSRAGTPWGFALRFHDADGKPVDDLRYDPEVKR